MTHGLIPGSAIVPVGAGDGDAETVGAIVGEAVGTGPILDGLGDGGTGVGDAGDADGTEPVFVAVGEADGPGDGCDLAQDETTSDAPLKMSSATRIERKLFMRFSEVRREVQDRLTPQAARRTQTAHSETAHS